MQRFFIKANDVEEKDSYQIFNGSGKPVYYTKDDFLPAGHRIKIFLADTINEVAYVQEKAGMFRNKFEFCARGDQFGTVERDDRFGRPEYDIDYNDWLIEGEGFAWNFNIWKGRVKIMSVRNQPYLIPGQALNITDTYIIHVDNDPDALLAIAFSLAIHASNKYRY